MNKELTDALRDRYPDMHPLVFHRSQEKAETPGELFDILDTIPDFPIIWDGTKRRWIQTEDLFLKKNFKKGSK